MSCFSAFFKVFYKLRYVSVIIWIAGLITCGFYALDFLSLTNLNFIPPDGSPAAIADKVLAEQFINDSEQSRFIVLMQLTDKNNPDYPDILANNWTFRTTELILDASKSFEDDPDILAQAMGRYTFEGQYDPQDEYAVKFLRTTFVSSNNRSSLLILSTKEKGTQNVMNWVRHMRSEFEKIDKVNDTFTIDLIGFDTLSFDMTDGATQDLKFMDCVSLPVALIVFIAILRSLTVSIIPVISVGSCVLLSFTIMVPIAKVMSIPSYCPAIMMSIEIAMSIDYSLFLLTRFHEEIKHGNPPILAAEKMLRFSGETILKSGLVFTVCLASLTTIPLQVIQAIGIGTVVALQSALLVALTFIPSLICVGLPFFSIPGLVPCATKSETGACQVRCCCCCSQSSDLAQVLPTTPGESAVDKFEEKKTKHWFKFSSWVSKPLNAFLVIVGVCALLAPFCCGMLKWSVVINEDHVLPRESPTHDAIARFEKEWPVGELYTFDIVAVPKNESESVFTEEFFNVFHDLAYAISNDSSEYFNISGILSPCDLAGTYIDFDTASFLLDYEEFAYVHIFNEQVNENRSAAKMTLASKINPNLNASAVPLSLRPIIDNFTATTNYSFYLTNQIVDMHDAVTYTFKELPKVILAIGGIIIVMVIIAFQAPVLSLHMLFTIVVTLLWSYGVIAIIFATDWFYWLTDRLSIAPGISWVLPILTLPVLIGLALDYNIFLFTRIHEFRQKGWAPRAALIMGVTHGGEVILYAGVIMAIAFSGMMFSGIMLLNQAGVLLSLGVLLCTYVISTTLNPALIYIFDFLNYWPRNFPINHKDPEMVADDSQEEKTPSEKTPLTINSINNSAYP